MEQNPYLQNVHVKSDNQINYLGGGINTTYPPQYIQNDECQDMYNLCLDNYPAIETRIGRRETDKIVLEKKPKEELIWLGCISNNSNFISEQNKFFYLTITEKLGVYDEYKLKDLEGNILDSFEDAAIEFNYIYSNNKEHVISYGKNLESKIYKSSSMEKIKETINFPERYIEHLCYHKNRYIAAVGNKLYFSALENPEDWSTPENSRIDTLNFSVTGLVSFDDKLIVFSENNMYIYYGSNIISGQNDSYTCVSLNNSIGCTREKSIVILNGFLYWTYVDKIYEYDGSTVRRIDIATGNNRC